MNHDEKLILIIENEPSDEYNWVSQLTLFISWLADQENSIKISSKTITGLT